jgi:putative flippase GtrA
VTPPSDSTLAEPAGLRRVVAGLSKRGNWLQLVKFGLVGGSGFVVNTVVYIVLLRRVGVPYLAAAAGAFCVAVANNFCWNRLWTFRLQRDSHAAFQAARFLTVSAVAFACNAALLTTFVEVFDADKVLAQLVAVTLVMPVSFLCNKLWSFR